MRVYKFYRMILHDSATIYHGKIGHSIHFLIGNKNLTAFSIPLNLSNNTLSDFARIVVSDDGKIAFVVWQDGTVNRDIMMRNIYLEK
jgi:hypothetical protein